MKNHHMILALVFLLPFTSCGASGNSQTTSVDALEYATFAQTLTNVIPDGLKTGGAMAASVSAVKASLSGTCAASYTDCPYLTTVGGGDSSTGEIFMRLWAMDYDDECGEALLSDGTCFSCPDCGSDGGQAYIMPTMLSDPLDCGSTSTMDGRYVNFGIDPCFFDAMVGQISGIAACETHQGGAVDISSAVPWYGSWGLSQTVNFSGYSSRDSGGLWWTVNSGEAGDGQVFLSVSPDWIYMGTKDTVNDRFLFLASGSAAYFETLGETGGSGVNIAAYAGPLSTLTKTFEAIQVRDQSYTYIERVITNDTHLFYQQWSSSDVPLTPADVDGVKNDPSDTRCVAIGASIAMSRYVPISDCVTAFEKTNEADLNSDDNYTLKMIDIQTAGAMDFATTLTDDSETGCVE